MEIIKETRAILACPCVFQVLTCATLQHAVMLSSLSIEAQFEGGNSTIHLSKGWRVKTQVTQHTGHTNSHTSYCKVGQEHMDSNLCSAYLMESAHRFLNGAEHTNFFVKWVPIFKNFHLRDVYLAYWQLNLSQQYPSIVTRIWDLICSSLAYWMFGQNTFVHVDQFPIMSCVFITACILHWIPCRAGILYNGPITR